MHPKYCFCMVQYGRLLKFSLISVKLPNITPTPTPNTRNITQDAKALVFVAQLHYEPARPWLKKSAGQRRGDRENWQVLFVLSQSLAYDGQMLHKWIGVLLGVKSYSRRLFSLIGILNFQNWVFQKRNVRFIFHQILFTSYCGWKKSCITLDGEKLWTMG